jgi:hypothetical protein
MLLVVQQFLIMKNIPVITQTLYSMGVALSDFWLFYTLKMGLKGAHFATMENIKSTPEYSKRSLPPVCCLVSYHNSAIPPFW